MKINNRNNLTNIYNDIEILAAIYRRRRHAESDPRAPSQGRNASDSYTLMTTKAALEYLRV